MQIEYIPTDLSMKKNILVLSSEGGGGHRSASEALKQILGNAYTIDVVNGINTVMTSFDWFKKMTNGRVTGEVLYNWFLQTERGLLLRSYISQGRRHFHRRKRQIAVNFSRFLHAQNKKYDLIISTIPYLNHGFTCVAKELGIPFLLLPTDLDITDFLNGFNELNPEDLSFCKLALAYNHPAILSRVSRNSPLSKANIVFTGFPVRPAFQMHYTEELLNSLKQQGQMELDRRTITLIMGAVGCNQIIEHSKVLSTLDSSWQINICVGRNEKSKQVISEWITSQGGSKLFVDHTLTTLLTKSGALLFLRGYTDSIISLLACADLIISKTGSCTVNEALYLGKRLLLDHSRYSTARFLPWEGFNIVFVTEHGLGKTFVNSQELSSLIPYMIEKERQPHPSFILPDFQTNIRALVQELIPC